MQLHQYRCYVLSFACPSDQSRCRVLYTLELCKHRLGDAIQQSVGIIEVRHDEGLR